MPNARFIWARKYTTFKIQQLIKASVAIHCCFCSLFATLFYVCSLHNITADLTILLYKTARTISLVLSLLLAHLWCSAFFIWVSFIDFGWQIHFIWSPLVWHLDESNATELVSVINDSWLNTSWKKVNTIWTPLLSQSLVQTVLLTLVNWIKQNCYFQLKLATTSP